MRTADPGDHTLVTEEGVELAPLTPEDLAERRCAERERIRAEVREVGVELLRSHEPDARPLLLPCLGENELGAPWKRSRNMGVFGPLAPGAR